MGCDRSPQRIALSLKKKQVRFYNGERAYRKTRSERTTRLKKKIRIIVDVSQPPLPYVEPKCCVKLAVHHGVVAYYTNYVLRCDATCYCNELCDFVCGRQTNFNNSNGKSRHWSTSPKKENIPPEESTRPKSRSCDSGFEEPGGYEAEVLDAEFVNIDVCHLSVWYCRVSPPGPEDLKVVRSSLYQVPSESATESECTGPPNKLCFKWHKDWEKSSIATRAQRKKILKETGALLHDLSRELKSKKEFPSKNIFLKSLIKSASSTPGELNLLQSGKSRTKMKYKPRSNTLPPGFEHKPRNLQSSHEVSERNSEQGVISDYDSDKEGKQASARPALDEMYGPVLEAIQKTSRQNKAERKGRSPSFLVDV